MKSFTLVFCSLLLVSTSTSQIPEYVPNEGLVAWFNFTSGLNSLTGDSLTVELNGSAILEDGLLDLSSNDAWAEVQGLPMEFAGNPEFSFVFLIERTSSFNGGAPWGIGGGIDSPLSYGQNINGWNESQTNEISIDLWGQSTWTTGVTYSAGSPDLISIIKYDGSFEVQNLSVFIGADSPPLSNVRGGGAWEPNLPPNGTLFLGKAGEEDNYFAPVKIGLCGLYNRAISFEEHESILQGVIQELYGCIDDGACNFNPDAVYSDSTCEYSCLSCGPGTIWVDSLASCIVSPSVCDEGTYWNEETLTCLPIETCPGDLNYDGTIGVNDLLGLLSLFGSGCEPSSIEWECGDPVSYHSYDYETVLIGEQCWFAENLRTELYQNGDSLLIELPQSEWGETDQGACAVHGEGEAFCNDDCGNGFDPCDQAYNLNLHGRLYNGLAVMDERGLCPSAWHVSSAEDWDELELFIIDMGFYPTQTALPLKSAEGWCACNGMYPGYGVDTINQLGFSATAGGDRDISGGPYGGYFSNGCYGTWWTPSSSGEFGDSRRIEDGATQVKSLFSSSLHVNHGRSIRCVKD